MKDVICGIYKITSPSGKIYIGQSYNIYKRWKGYKKDNVKNQRKLYHSFLKYGVENHKFEVIHTCKEEELNTLEEKYVLEFKCVEEGLNIRYGGGNKGKLSSEYKDKIRNKLKGTKRSEESIKKHRLTLQKNGVWNKGKTGIFSEEALIKIGKTHSIESIEKTASKLRGRKHTLEHRIKNSESNKGRKVNEETRKKISDKAKLYWENIRQERAVMIF
jgi:group I intron endonuclease